MAQVGPDDAVSNLARWYGKFGVAPDWLKNPGADTIWTIAFGAMALLSLIAFFLPERFFSRRRKPQGSTGIDGLSREAAIALGIEPKPRYAAPRDADNLDIRRTTYKELGELTESVGKDVQRFEQGVAYNATDVDVISEFQKRMAPYVMWVYEEARNRGHREKVLEVFYLDPGALRRSGIEWIGKALISLGARLTLYIDP